MRNRSLSFLLVYLYAFTEFSAPVEFVERRRLDCYVWLTDRLVLPSPIVRLCWLLRWHQFATAAGKSYGGLGSARFAYLILDWYFSLDYGGLPATLRSYGIGELVHRMVYTPELVSVVRCACGPCHFTQSSCPGSHAIPLERQICVRYASRRCESMIPCTVLSRCVI